MADPKTRAIGGGALTLAVVAAEAGVSTATVSRVLNKSGPVAEATVDRVMSAVLRMGYTPNLQAGGLASSRTRLVATVVPTISQSLFGETIQSMTDALWERGFHVLLALGGSHDEHVEEMLVSLMGRRPDGIILTGTVASPQLRARLKAASTPIIETWDLPASPIDMAVGFSHQALGQALGEYAMRKGYGRPLLLFASGVRAFTRRYGFSRVYMENGRPEPEHVVLQSPSTFAQGRSAFSEALDRGLRPDCVVCSSDWAALGVLTEAQRRGLRVPQDLAVIGFSDQDFAAHTEPPLTTVRIDGRAIGRRAADFLLARMEGGELASPIADVGFLLVERESG